MFRFVILGILRDRRARHGYALLKAYSALFGVTPNSGSFYREVKELLECGWITTVSSTTGVDDRVTPYVVTAAGEAEFRRWIRSPLRRQRSREDEIGVRSLLLSNHADKEDLALLKHWQDGLWIEAKSLERLRNERGRAGQTSQEAIGLDLLLMRRLALLAADIEFIEAWQQHLESRVDRDGATSNEGRRANAINQNGPAEQPGEDQPVGRPPPPPTRIPAESTPPAPAALKAGRARR